MKKKIIQSTFVIFCLTTFYFNSVSSASNHKLGQVITVLRAGNNIEDVINRHVQVDNVQTELRISRSLSKDLNIWLLEFNPVADENKLLRSIREDASVAAAQFNYFLNLRNIPNDPLFANEWDWDNTGQGGGVVGADVDAINAWDITTGGLTAQGDTIVVAVVDCGFDLNHIDLDFWKNYSEIPANSIDDDNNGYIDDYDGWSGYGNGIIDQCSHGTHVSGTIGARGNNNIGVVGVNWNVKVMPLPYGDGDDAGAIECYGYAFSLRRLYNMTNGAQGAFVVSTNSSFGIDFGQPADHPAWCAMYDSLGSAGILSAGAGPNLDIDIDIEGDIPTACPSDWLIAVTNTTRNDLRNSGAGYGALNMDMGAPGTSIWSTIPNDQYTGTYTGTSMATPHVAGAVALMWAAACDEMITDYKNNPPGLASVLKNIMLNSVDTISALTGITVSQGRLNLFKSLVGVQNYCANLGIHETSSDQQHSMFFYPNPVSDVATLYFYSQPGLHTVLEINDVPGKKVFSQSLNKFPSEGMQTALINLSGIKPGIYFARVVADDGNYSVVQKIVVN